MKLLTGNDLKSGLVTWWNGDGWSINIEDAINVGENGDAILTTEEEARRVNSPYIIDAETDANADNGAPRPGHIKDRVRALGPTVRSDLTLKPNDASAIDKVV